MGKLTSLWQKYFSGNPLPNGDALDKESLVQLIAAAKDDANLRQQILAILDQPPFQRQSRINTWISDLRLQQAPSALITALTFLLDDKVATKAQQLLADPVE